MKQFIEIVEYAGVPPLYGVRTKKLEEVGEDFAMGNKWGVKEIAGFVVPDERVGVVLKEVSDFVKMYNQGILDKQSKEYLPRVKDLTVIVESILKK